MIVVDDWTRWLFCIMILFLVMAFITFLKVAYDEGKKIQQRERDLPQDHVVSLLEENWPYDQERDK